jgi:hypothetical protein
MNPQGHRSEQPERAQDSAIENAALRLRSKGIPVGRAITICLTSISLAAIPIIGLSSLLYPLMESLLPKLVAAIASLGLASVPIIISMVHATFRDRQLQRLTLWKDTPIAKTAFYNSALRQISGLKVASLEFGYLIPMLVLFFNILFFSITLFTFPWFQSFFEWKSFILGGMYAITNDNPVEILAYQRQTFLCGMVAFLGSYIYLISRLWERINNSDIYPNSYYYYTIRIITSFIVAIVFRHSMAAFGVTNSELIVFISFIIGFTPDFFVIALSRKAYDIIKVYGSKKDPDDPSQPRSMPLLMLDDMSREKIDRLSELGVDSAHTLARANPLGTWPRLPYDLELIIEWVAQAQLYTIVRDEGIRKLRDKCVANIFHLQPRLSDEDAREEICAILGISNAAGLALLEQLSKDQSYVQLCELRDALIGMVTKTEKTQTTSSEPATGTPPAGCASFGSAPTQSGYVDNLDRVCIAPAVSIPRPH